MFLIALSIRTLSIPRTQVELFTAALVDIKQLLHRDSLQTLQHSKYLFSSTGPTELPMFGPIENEL